MAYRTVNPYAFGNAKQSSADLASVSSEYAYSGVPEAVSIHDCANSGVRKLEDVGGVTYKEDVVIDFDISALLVVKAFVDDIAKQMARVDDDNFMIYNIVAILILLLTVVLYYDAAQVDGW